MRLDKNKLFHEQSSLKNLNRKKAIAKAQIKNNELCIKEKLKESKNTRYLT